MSANAIHRKIPTLIEIIAFVKTNGLFDRSDLLRDDGEVDLGRRMRAGGDIGVVSVERGNGGGTEGGGKLTGLVWQFFGVAAM